MARHAKRILMVNAFQTGGGAGRVGEALTTAFRRRHHAVDAFVKANEGHDAACHTLNFWRTQKLERWLAKQGWLDVANPTSFLWWAHPRFAAADVVHLHNLHGDFLSILAMPIWARYKPLVWTLHDNWAMTGGCASPRGCERWKVACGHCPLSTRFPMVGHDHTRFFRSLKPSIFKAARPRIVTPSAWLAARVKQIPHFRKLDITVIPNPVDCETFRPATQRAAIRERLGLTVYAPVVLITGHDWRDRFKGGPEAIAALQAAAQQMPELQILAVGRESRALLSQTGLPGRALPFTSNRHELADAYAAADITLFPSRAENYPLTTLESMSAGTPVVAFDVGGIPEQIDHLQTGWLAPDGDVTSLRDGILRLTRYAEDTRRMGHLARDTVRRRNSIPVIATLYLDEYDRARAAWRRRFKDRPIRYERGPLARRIANWMNWHSPTRAEAAEWHPVPRESRP
jgi:glycosyltransferase involved in cell wall biosynthesis